MNTPYVPTTGKAREGRAPGIGEVELLCTRVGRIRWPRLQEIIPEAERGRAKIVHFEVSEEAHLRSLVREFRGWDPNEHPDQLVPVEVVDPGRYVKLVIDGQVMMSNTQMEKGTNVEFIERAHGRVLIAGLGLGLVLPPVLDKPDVESVLVVELLPEVIELVAPFHVHPKLAVVQGDIFTWEPTHDQLGIERGFNTIYFDIWHTFRIGDLHAMYRLMEKGRAWLDPQDDHAWTDSWRRLDREAKKRKTERLIVRPREFKGRRRNQ